MPEHDETTLTCLRQIDEDLRPIPPEQRQEVLDEAVRRLRHQASPDHRRREHAIGSLMATLKRMECHPAGGLLAILRRAGRAIRQQKEER